MDFSRQTWEGPVAVGVGGYVWNKVKGNTQVQTFVSKVGGKTNAGLILVALGVVAKAYKPESEAMNILGYLLAGLGAGALGDDLPATGSQATFTNKSPEYPSPVSGVNVL
ncbi:structural protein a109 [Metallosphaera turreted icosahedral virus]|uniref:virion structural protein n=1 Tax=Metallosphaera turreted icosahedral virus TaxID=2023155 RepID=UPI000B8D4C26|nr:virion structural protein [Metallosphaera turreted icosahedral virus]ASO67392.1 structural protein a109 [Metallosphaera turreted icosahedral virus]ASO67413.1 structural protein a109 [Metallosphaera turreted icosahedral virus]